jgi:type IV pilus assembly protein PilW
MDLKKGKTMNFKLKQRGATLVELMVGLALSLIVTASMVGLMSNSLGSTTRIVQMTQLTDELRNSMSMLSRDVRRANYNPYALYCYANANCGVDDVDTGLVNVQWDIDTATASCIRYSLEREINADGSLGTLSGGGLRREVTADGIGTLEIWTGNDEPPANCADDADWLRVTDPNFVNITEFTVDESNSFEETVTDSDGNVLANLRTREVQIAIGGNLVRDASIAKRIEDVIRVRNDFVST